MRRARGEEGVRLPEKPRVVIVGAGIGGLCAAIALRRVGIDAVVLERSSELREVGAGIQLWVTGMRALQKIGLAQGSQGSR